MGIFDAQADIFTSYLVTLRYKDRVMGGIPKNPKILSDFIKHRAGVDAQEELTRAMHRQLAELGVPVNPDATYEEMEAALADYERMEKAADAISMSKHTNGFKRDENGIYLESRLVKSMAKEVTNIRFAGVRWGATKKGPKSFLAERVFVEPSRLYLLRKDDATGRYTTLAEPDGVDLFIGHTTGPKGPQSNLTLYEFCERPYLRFVVMSADDAIKADDWVDIWVHAQFNGLGALRSQGHGMFDILEWNCLGKTILDRDEIFRRMDLDRALPTIESNRLANYETSPIVDEGYTPRVTVTPIAD